MAEAFYGNEAFCEKLLTDSVNAYEYGVPGIPRDFLVAFLSQKWGPSTPLAGE